MRRHALICIWVAGVSAQYYTFQQFPITAPGPGGRVPFGDPDAPIVSTADFFVPPGTQNVSYTTNSPILYGTRTVYGKLNPCLLLIRSHLLWSVLQQI